MVLIHGWALNLREWDDQIAALSPHYRVVAFDRRGYGRSSGFADVSADPGRHPGAPTLRIRSAVGWWAIGRRPGAVRFAAAMPERVDALVLYGGGEPDSFPVPQKGPVRHGQTARAAGRRGRRDPALSSLPQFRPSPHRAAAIAARLDTMLAGIRARICWRTHPESGAFPQPQSDAMRRWPMPTLFISGDREGPRWQLVNDSPVRWMPAARKVLIPGGGHGVHFDEPQQFNTALLAFLQDVRKAG